MHPSPPFSGAAPAGTPSAAAVTLDTTAPSLSAADPREHQPVPPLRDDLQLHEAGRDAQGEPQWSIQDPVTNRFYRIGWLEFECLTRWGHSPRRLCDEIDAATALSPEVGDILALVDFLDHHRLLRATAEVSQRLAQQAQRGAAWQSLSWWLHHYLFFRLPLVRPQHFLEAMVGRLPWLFTQAMVGAVLILSLIGLILVIKRWDLFTHAVMDAFSFSGIVSFALALVVAKACHELGHALVATRLGVRVAHMGVAFIVLWPMLYTDTGESWKLRRSRSRLAISSAGMLVELGLAGVATLGWVLTEPGPLNSALLYLATTSWVLSLAINASPFMRFDGYFVLSDLLDFPNLHERAGGQARTWLRRRLLGLSEDWPEPFMPHQRRALILFAFATWIYRLLLFLGIALAVYHLFFKALGIALFAVEIAWFILMPVSRELSHWWASRRAVPRRHRLGWLLALALAVVLVCLPWQTRVSGPGLLHAEHELTVYSPFPARLERLMTEGAVSQGTALASLVEPDIQHQLRSSEQAMAWLDAELAGLLAADDGLDRDAATLAQRRVNESHQAAASQELSRLTLRAPFSGVWQRQDLEQAQGQWVAPQQPLGLLLDPSRWLVDAYLPQDDAHRLTPGAKVRIFAEGQLTPLEGELVSVGATRATELAHPSLAARHGGPLSTQPATDQTQDTLRLADGRVAVKVRLLSPWPEARRSRAQVHVDAERESLAGQFFTWLAAVVIRESGF
ncbi:HlyD family efflux transporter periplasmic adaptor subunit [Halomonas sp. DP8Y7-1]|uniref:HlyD family efflux transporter periplasmic adaptor subunit n=1 Tax=Halomonas sp. DP8Y7-1 TaxID=2859078 RepID=UPI001C98341C|nr:HlyD family efflux transporter periplasmic adaptor subunit [Halomonas sp. DP8Y7-1]MBY6029573.1 HlyD family efflux transporter periplasmic adaptor subunit [Halomonas sp. DP8Y7-1]